MFQFEKQCSQWINEVDDNPAVKREQKLFGASDEFSEMLKRVNLRLGGDLSSKEKTEKFSLDDVRIMYNLCRFMRALDAGKNSVWCTAFGKEDLEVSIIIKID